jgi:hypothetical protein
MTNLLIHFKAQPFFQISKVHKVFNDLTAIISNCNIFFNTQLSQVPVI